MVRAASLLSLIVALLAIAAPPVHADIVEDIFSAAGEEVPIDYAAPDEPEVSPDDMTALSIVNTTYNIDTVEHLPKTTWLTATTIKLMRPDATFFYDAETRTLNIGIPDGDLPDGQVSVTVALQSDCPNNSQYHVKPSEDKTLARIEPLLREALTDWTRQRHSVAYCDTLRINVSNRGPGVINYDVQLDLKTTADSQPGAREGEVPASPAPSA